MLRKDRERESESEWTRKKYHLIHNFIHKQLQITHTHSQTMVNIEILRTEIKICTKIQNENRQSIKMKPKKLKYTKSYFLCLYMKINATFITIFITNKI